MNDIVDINALSFELISSKRDLDSFKCSENQESEEIEQFLKKSALTYHKEGLARTVLVLRQDALVGYYYDSGFKACEKILTCLPLSPHP